MILKLKGKSSFKNWGMLNMYDEIFEVVSFVSWSTRANYITTYFNICEYSNALLFLSLLFFFWTVAKILLAEWFVGRFDGMRMNRTFSKWQHLSAHGSENGQHITGPVGGTFNSSASNHQYHPNVEP